MKGKLITNLLFLILLASCDPFNFGFKKNPAYILNETFIAIKNLDQQSFIEVTGKEVLCTYGNPEGLDYLKKHMEFEADDVKITPVKISEAYASSPKFVGFWSYLQERYKVEVVDEKTLLPLLYAYMDCDYGTDLEKNEKLLNLPKEKYRKKECQLVKVEPVVFQPLPLPKACEIMKIKL